MTEMQHVQIVRIIRCLGGEVEAIHTHRQAKAGKLAGPSVCQKECACMCWRFDCCIYPISASIIYK